MTHIGRSPVLKYGMREFSDLKTSTSTVMLYTNVEFNILNLFCKLPIFDCDVTLTKKQKNIDKKKLDAPYGNIVSLQTSTYIRGLDLHKKKKHWCTVCQQYKITKGKEVKVKMITEYIEETTTITLAGLAKTFRTPIKKIMYHCPHCEDNYDPSQLKKINHFLNQLTIVISIGKQPLLNIMLFKNSLKIAGCKDKKDAAEALMILWQDWIVKDTRLWHFRQGCNIPRFQFETVMRNVDFELGFPIDRDRLNMMMNEKQYSDVVFMSHYESTGQTNVNIKMPSIKPDGFEYDWLTIPLDTSKKPYFKKTTQLTYKNPNKKNKGSNHITFIVFSSSKTILSGRYDQNMKDMYEFLCKLLNERRADIEEIIVVPSKKRLAQLLIDR